MSHLKRICLLFSSLLLVIFLLGLASLVVSAQAVMAQIPTELASVPGNRILLRAADYAANTRVLPPAPPEALPQAPAVATFNVVFSGTWPAPATNAFNYAVGIWAGLVTSTVPIDIEAEWSALGPGILGSAGTSNYWSGGSLPLPGVLYPDAMVDSLLGFDVGPAYSRTGVEIFATFNSDFSNWYYGTDTFTPPGQYDFVSVVLHEIGHGLGFAGSARELSPGVGIWGYGGQPTVFDCFSADGPISTDNNIIDTTIYPNPSAALGSALTSGSVYFGGANASSANGGPNARLYSPADWEQGSSYSHLDEDTYPAGNANSLMTPSLASAEAVHNPGTITMAIFDDMGWDGSGSASACPSAPTVVGLASFQAKVKRTGIESQLLDVLDFAANILQGLTRINTENPG